MNTPTNPNMLQREVDHAGKVMSGMGHDAKEMLQDVKSSVTDTAHNVMNSGRRLGRDGIEAVGSRVEANPIASIAIAAGIGFLLGAVLRR